MGVQRCKIKETKKDLYNPEYNGKQVESIEVGCIKEKWQVAD